MKHRSALWLGSLALAGTLVLQAPASLLVIALDRACPDRCRLAESEGSLWRGYGQLYLRGEVSAPWVSAGSLHWRLGLGGLRLGLDEGSLVLVPSPQGIDLVATGLALPAALVPPLFSGLPRSGWGGRLVLAEAHGSYAWQGQCQGRGSLRWQGARTSLIEGATDLGDYRLDFLLGRDGKTEMSIHTDRGVLGIEGLGEVSAEGAGRLDLEIQPAKDIREQAEPLLRGIAHPVDVAQGRYRVQLEVGGRRQPHEGRSWASAMPAPG